MGFSLLIQEPEYMEWVENIHLLTLNFIKNPSIPVGILQNFLEYWSLFSYYAEKKDTPVYAQLRKILLDVAITFLNTQCDIINNNNGVNYKEEVFENDAAIHEYMRPLALLSQPK